MPRIALDMDQVLVNNYAYFTDLYKQRYGRRPDPSEYASRKIYTLEPGGAELAAERFRPGFYRHLPIAVGAREVVRELHGAAEVLVVTAAQEFRHSLVDKYDWLQEQLPFLHWRQFAFVGAKHYIAADYLVDDHVKHLRTFGGRGVLFEASHNLGNTEFTRVRNWAEVRAFFRAEGVLP